MKSLLLILFIGANLWNGDINELDALQAIGVNNIRVKATDGENLDPLLTELEKRDMQAVLFLTNAWEWSTGYEQYYNRATGEPILLPSEVGYPYYMEHAGRFLSNAKAVSLFDEYVTQMVNKYKHYRSIYAWEIANEPRAFGQDPDVLVNFIDHEAKLIKKLDPNHKITTGSEGIWGCNEDSVLCRRVHEIPEIDYMTCHIWPYNWGWLQNGIDWKANVKQYIQWHEDIATRIDKPFIIEEFGFPRDNGSLEPNTPTTQRDEMYRLIFQSLQTVPHLIGANFWCWKQDPPQEPQGLNSVLPTDESTLQVIKAPLGVPSLATLSSTKPNLCPTPPMGWSTWNTFACNINEDIIKAIADEMVDSGLRDAGYIYLNIDDCWHGQRDADGFIQPDPERFPSGMRALADYVHSKGLKLGIYSDAGTETCGGRPGSLGHEYQDALQYARWGIDYLKYDWCSTENVNAKGAYSLMAKALRASGRDIVFSLCEWGDNKAYEWAEPVGHLWRTTGDISWCLFDGVKDNGTWRSLGVMTIVDKNEKLRQYAGPNHWNDPDMLEVGNGMTPAEDRTHFTLWCMMAAPLILGNDIRSMSVETKALITHPTLIAIDQDPLGIQGWREKTEDWLEYWIKPLQNDKVARCIVNRGNEPKTIELNKKIKPILPVCKKAQKKFTIAPHDVIVYIEDKQ